MKLELSKRDVDLILQSLKETKKMFEMLQSGPSQELYTQRIEAVSKLIAKIQAIMKNRK